MFTLAFSTYFGVERRFYQLAHNLVLSMPGLGFLRKYGTVAATPANAAQALESGRRAARLPRRRLRGAPADAGSPGAVDFDGRKGFLRLALEHDVPIVPVVSIGGQETALFLTRGEGLAKLLRLDRMFRLKVLPISLALPWGLNVGDMLGHLPAPAKITIQVLTPIDLREEFGEDPDLDEMYTDVLGRMQSDAHRAAGRADPAGARLMRVERKITIDGSPRGDLGARQATRPTTRGLWRASRAASARSEGAPTGSARATRCGCTWARPTWAAWWRWWSSDEPGDLSWTNVTGIDQRGRWRLREPRDGRTEGHAAPLLRGARGLLGERVRPDLGRRWWGATSSGTLERLKREFEGGGTAVSEGGGGLTGQDRQRARRRRRS